MELKQTTQMKKIMYMAVAAIAALSSCSSEEFTQGSNGINGEAKVFIGTTENDGVSSRSTLVNKTANWESTDEVSINGVTYTTTPDADATKATFTKKTSTDTDPTATYKAVYPATMASGSGASTTFSLPASYTYDATKSDAKNFNMPMYAQSETKSLGFKNICGVLAIKVTSAEMSSVTSITVTSDKAISGTCDIKSEDVSGVAKYHAEAKGTADADKTVTLTCSSAVTPKSESEGGTVFYVPVPVISDATLYVTVNGDVATAKASSYSPFIYTQSMKATGVSIERNKIYNITFATSLAKFTVGDNSGTKTVVNFTNANVYYDGSALQFESSQIGYDKGTTSGSTTTYTSTHVSHFFWNSTLETSVASSYTETGAATYFAHNVTVNGTSGLRVLTGGNNSGEYYYLITTRGVNLRKYGVTVTDGSNSASNCLIIAPDNFVGTLKSSYTLDELKAYGLVCLPAAGNRYGSSLSDGGSIGKYWSASPSVSNGKDAYYLSFYDSDVAPACSGYGRTGGYSIRLVK